MFLVSPDLLAEPLRGAVVSFGLFQPPPKMYKSVAIATFATAASAQMLSGLSTQCQTAIQSALSNSTLSVSPYGGCNMLLTAA
jgi:hypothetical protein